MLPEVGGSGSHATRSQVLIPPEEGAGTGIGVGGSIGFEGVMTGLGGTIGAVGTVTTTRCRLGRLCADTVGAAVTAGTGTAAGGTGSIATDAMGAGDGVDVASTAESEAANS